MPYKDPEKQKLNRKEYYEKNKKDILAKDKVAKKAKFEALSEEEQSAYINKRKDIANKSYANNKETINEKNKERRHLYALKSNYGLTIDDYNELLESQNNVCAICGKEEARKGRKLPLVVDHCHTTDVVRGLLCQGCNLGLGHFKDDIDALEKAIVYLKNNNE